MSKRFARVRATSEIRATMIVTPRRSRKIFKKIFFSQTLEKLIPIADVEACLVAQHSERPRLHWPSKYGNNTALSSALVDLKQHSRRAVLNFDSVPRSLRLLRARCSIVRREKGLATSLLRLKPNEKCEQFMSALDHHQVSSPWTQRALFGMEPIRSSDTKRHLGLRSEHGFHGHRIQALLH